MPHRARLLFVCGKNLKRSPTGAALYRNDPRIEVRSAGVSQFSRHTISEADVQWAELILVMERKHQARVREMFAHLHSLPPIVSLDIPDDYELMDAELVELLTTATEHYLAEFLSHESEPPPLP